MCGWKEIWQLRSRVYSYLGDRLLNPPREGFADDLRPEFWMSFPLNPANRQMEEALHELSLLLSGVNDGNINKIIDDIAIEYTISFVGPGSPPAPPWESLYRNEGSVLFGQPTFDIKEFVRKNALIIDDGSNQLEDHLGIELLILSAISKKALLTKPSVRDIIAQITFLEQHPLWWVETFQAKVEQCSSVGYYSSITKLAWGFMLWDRDLLIEYKEELTNTT